jgi:hypothetical protein
VVEGPAPPVNEQEQGGEAEDHPNA